MKVLLKKGMPANIASYTGTAGELVISDSAAMVYIVDGTTPGGHPVDGVTYSVNAPSIIAPVDASTGVDPSPVLQCSAFVGSGAHVATYWEVATDSGFTTIIHDSGRDTVNLLQYSLANASVTLDPLTTYYVRAKHESTLTLVSEYSTVVSFETKSNLLFTNLIDTINPSELNNPSSTFGSTGEQTNDGVFIILGAYHYNNYDGIAGIFKRSGNNWVLNQTFNGAAGARNYLGRWVSISGDGLVAAISESAYGGGVTASGRVSIYRRANTNTPFGNVIYLLEPTNNIDISFGANVKVTSDGTRIIVGSHNTLVTWVFIWNGYSYVLEQIIDDGGDRAMAISDDGLTIAIGNYAGRRVSIYTNNAGVWSLDFTYTHPVKFIGINVAISGDGNTIAAAEYVNMPSAPPQIHIFTKNGGSWDISTVEALDLVTGDTLGYGLGVSNTMSFTYDGTILVSNAYKSGAGGAYIFKKDAGTWIQHQKIVGLDYNTQQYNNIVNITRDGGQLLLGSGSGGYSYPVHIFK